MYQPPPGNLAYYVGLPGNRDSRRSATQLHGRDCLLYTSFYYIVAVECSFDDGTCFGKANFSSTNFGSWIIRFCCHEISSFFKTKFESIIPQNISGVNRFMPPVTRFVKILSIFNNQMQDVSNFTKYLRFIYMNMIVSLKQKCYTVVATAKGIKERRRFHYEKSTCNTLNTCLLYTSIPPATGRNTSHSCS